MSGEPPTQYENYPHSSAPESPPAPNRWNDPPAPAPLVRAYRPDGSVGATANQVSRRGVIAGVVGIAALGGLLMAANAGPRGGLADSEEYTDDWSADDPFDDSADEPIDQSDFEFGGKTFEVPEGWQIEGSAESRVVLSNGSNQLLVVSYSDAVGSAAQELVDSLDRSNTPFSGATGKVKKSSTGSVDRATAKGAGKYEGKAARQIVDLFLYPDEASALFVRQILTAADGSSIANQAGRLLADLRDFWR